MASPSLPISDDVYDVVIIGAGASGLACASHLLSSKSPPSILVLEALSYVGGRVCTVTLAHTGVRVDAGAEFIHGSTTLLNALVTQYSLPTCPIFTAAQGDGGPDDDPTPAGHYGVYYLTDEKVLLRYDSDDTDFTSMNNSFHSLSSLDPKAVPLHKSVAESISVPSRMSSLANAGYANTCCCSSLSDISLRRTVEYECHWESNDGCSTADGGDCRLTDNHFMSDIIDILSSPVLPHVKLSTNVTSINYTSAVSTITCPSLPTQILARRVVVTVPVKVLQDGDIEFVPPLPPSKTEALNLYGMEDAVKMFLVFRAPVWPEKVQNCIISNSPIPEMWFRKCLKTNYHVCCCFATAGYAAQLKQMGEEKAVGLALSLLNEMFSLSSHAHFLESSLICWSDVSSIRGGYSYPKVGISRESVEEIQQPIDNKLFFAGEATHTGAAMTMHAAMETGILVAKKIEASSS